MRKCSSDIPYNSTILFVLFNFVNICDILYDYSTLNFDSSEEYYIVAVL